MMCDQKTVCDKLKKGQKKKQERGAKCSSACGSSRPSRSSSGSSASRACLLAEAERAALAAHVAALKEEHALEEETEQLRSNKDIQHFNQHLCHITAET